MVASPARPGRSVAQPGSASAWGAEGREFESHRSDHIFGMPEQAVGRLGRILAARAIAAAFALLTAGSAMAAQPVPDCARARSLAERAICSDPALKMADAEMARAFAALRAALPPPQHSALLADQRQWLGERDAACRQQQPALVECLRRQTDVRRRFLAGEGPNGATAAPRLLPSFEHQANSALRYTISVRYPQIHGRADAAAA